MNIKTWQERYTNCSLEQAMQAEIDELRAALQERDARDAAHTEIDAQRVVLEQALEALQTCRIRSVTEGEVREVTPKIITNAITAIQEQLA